MFGFLLVGQAIGIVDQYFKEEASEEDFWEIDRESYPNLEEDFSFMINPDKLKDKYVESAEVLIVTQEEKASLLKALEILRKSSEDLTEEASLQERLLFAKRVLPSVFFNRKSPTEGCKIIPLVAD